MMEALLQHSLQGSALWTATGIVVALILFLFPPRPVSEYASPWKHHLIRTLLRLGPSCGFFLIFFTPLTKASGYPEMGACTGGGGLFLFFLGVAALVYDRAIASEAMKKR